MIGRWRRSVVADVLEFETLRQREVVLDGRQLPGPTDGVSDLHVDLGTVEGAAAFIDVEADVLGDERARRCSIASAQPSSVPTDFSGGRVDRLASKSSNPNARSTDSTKFEQAADLVVGLLLGAVDVRVVLGEATDPQQPVERPRQLVAVHGAELVEPQGQLAVGPLPRLVDEVVHRAVHGLRVVLAVVHLHRGVHGVGIEIEVTRDLEQAGVGQVRGVRELVPTVLVPLPRVVLHQLADDRPLRMPHGETPAQFGRERQQVELVGQPAMIAQRSLLEPFEVRGEVLLRRPRRAIDALQHRVLLARPASRHRRPSSA